MKVLALGKLGVIFVNAEEAYASWYRGEYYVGIRRFQLSFSLPLIGWHYIFRLSFFKSE